MTSWLHEQRLQAVLAAVRESGARQVADLGCGEGDLLLRLVREPQIERLVGVELSAQSLQRLREGLQQVPEAMRGRVELLHGPLQDLAGALQGVDLAALVEVIEHLDPASLSALERGLFRQMRPACILLTTPNAEFNPLLGVPAHRFRHPDHRFEWGRAKFRGWAEGVARRNGYAVACADLAGTHPTLGGSSQMASFRRLHPSPAPGADPGRAF